MRYNQLITYFKNLTAAIADLQQHYHGDAEEIINRVNQNLTYPILWSETPECSTAGDSDGLTIKYTGHVVILNQLNRDSTNELDVLTATQDIALRVMYHMKEDAYQNRSRYNISRVSMQPVPDTFIDKAVGWRIGYTIESSLGLGDYCPDYVTTDM